MYAIRSYYEISSTEAYETARYCLMDALGCGMLALGFPECAKHLGPLVAGTVVPHGARVPGTQFRITSYNVCYTKLLRASQVSL